MELIKVEKNSVSLQEEVVKKIIEIEEIAKYAKEAKEQLTEALLKEMEEGNITKIEAVREDKVLTIKYVAPTDRETFDAKQLRSEDQDLYDKYVRITPVKASVRVSVK